MQLYSMEEVGKGSYATNTYPTTKLKKKRRKQTGRNENMKETN